MDELKIFCDWFATHHGRITDKSVFITCMCGHFHTYSKRATAMLAQLKTSGLVEVKGGKVYILQQQPHDP